MSEGLPLEGVETPVRGGIPERWRIEGGEIGLPCLRGRGWTTGMGVEGKSLEGISGGVARSARHKSGGVGTLRRSSSDKEGVALVGEDEGADSKDGAERLFARRWAADNWSLRMLISSLASKRMC